MAAKQPSGRQQATKSRKGKQHRDVQVDVNFNAVYGGGTGSYDLFKNNFRFEAFAGGDRYPISNFVTQASWTEQTATSGGRTSVLLTPGLGPLTAPMTGTVTLSKPALSQYHQLLPPFLAASVDPRSNTDRFGALGVVIVASVGYGRSYLPLWAMRVAPADGQSSAESVSLQDGAWTLNLADGFAQLQENVGDFKFTRGKRVRKNGWRAHEVAAAVVKQYQIPCKQLARGTSYFELTASTDTQSVDPMTVITAAYREEMKRTGKIFVISWGAPDRHYPVGGLQVLPLRRNPSLLVFRKQLIEAVIGRSLSPEAASVVLARGQLRQKAGKTRNLTYVHVSAQAVKRIGYIQKIVDFGSVSSELELQMLAKRYLAFNLTPIRSAELTHPGIATLRSGDAIRIDLPEEGYAKMALSIATKPNSSAAALLAAEKNDPGLFGIFDPALIAADPSHTQPNSAYQDATQAANPVAVPVADQGIAFVSSIQHTLGAASYSIDVQTGFTDMLDPAYLQQYVDAVQRAAKGTTAAATGTGTKWLVPASAEDDPPGASASCGPLPADRRGYSVLSVSGRSSDAATAGQALSPGSVWPCSTQLIISNPANGKSVTVNHVDNGAGSDSILPVVGLYPTTRSELGLSGGSFHVVIQRTDGGALTPVRGKKV